MTHLTTPTVQSPILARCMREQLQSVWNTMTPDDHIAHVDKLLRERRARAMPVPVDRRLGRQPRHMVVDNDTETDSI